MLVLHHEAMVLFLIGARGSESQAGTIEFLAKMLRKRNYCTNVNTIFKSLERRHYIERNGKKRGKLTNRRLHFKLTYKGNKKCKKIRAQVRKLASMATTKRKV